MLCYAMLCYVILYYIILYYIILYYIILYYIILYYNIICHCLFLENFGVLCCAHYILLQISCNHVKFVKYLQRSKTFKNPYFLFRTDFAISSWYTYRQCLLPYKLWYSVFHYSLCGCLDLLPRSGVMRDVYPDYCSTRHFRPILACGEDYCVICWSIT